MTPRPSSKRNHRSARVAGRLLLQITALAVLAAALLPLPGCGSGSGPAPEAIWVHSFENATGNPDLDLWNPWLSDMMVRSLWQAETPGVWSPLRSLDTRRRLGEVGRKETLDEAVRAGADAVLFGRVSQEAAGLLLSADLVSSRSGETLASLQTRAENLPDLPAGIDRLRDELWKTYGIEVPGARPVTSMTTDVVAAYGRVTAGDLEYVEGRYLSALGAYRGAAEQAPLFSLAHYRMVTAAMQYAVVPSDELKKEVTLAWARRDRLGERDRLAVHGLRSLLFRELEEASAAYEEVRRRWPDDKEMAFFHGVALSQQGDNAASLEAYRAAAAMDPEFLQAWEAVALIAFSLDRRDEARQAVNSALEVNPVDTRLLDAAATFDLFEGDIDSARKRIEQTLRFRQDPGLLMIRAQADLLEGKIDSAMETFLQLKSPIAAAIAEIYSGRINAALTRFEPMVNFQIAAANRGSAAIGLWMTGILLKDSEQPKLAESQFTRSLNFAPTFVDCLEALGVMMAEGGDLKRARSILQSMEENPRPFEPGGERHTLRVKGAVARAEGNFEQAVRFLREAKPLARARFLGGAYISDRPLYVETLAETLLEQGDVEAAEQEFRELTEMAADRLYWPWIWLRAHVRLAELAARDQRPEDASRHAQAVRTYWGAAERSGQPLVDDLLSRLDRITPAATASR